MENTTTDQTLNMTTDKEASNSIRLRVEETVTTKITNREMEIVVLKRMANTISLILASKVGRETVAISQSVLLQALEAQKVMLFREHPLPSNLKISHQVHHLKKKTLILIRK